MSVSTHHGPAIGKGTSTETTRRGVTHFAAVTHSRVVFSDGPTSTPPPWRCGKCGRVYCMCAR